LRPAKSAARGFFSNKHLTIEMTRGKPARRQDGRKQRNTKTKQRFALTSIDLFGIAFAEARSGKTMEKNISKLIEAARKLDSVCEERDIRLKQVCELAAEARRTGESQKHKLSELPPVYDITNEIAEIRKAIKRIR
jgi:hypothetical protein